MRTKLKFFIETFLCIGVLLVSIVNYIYGKPWLRIHSFLSFILVSSYLSYLLINYSDYFKKKPIKKWVNSFLIVSLAAVVGILISFEIANLQNVRNLKNKMYKLKLEFKYNRSKFFNYYKEYMLTGGQLFQNKAEMAVPLETTVAENVLGDDVFLKEMTTDKYFLLQEYVFSMKRLNYHIHMEKHTKETHAIFKLACDDFNNDYSKLAYALESFDSDALEEICTRRYSNYTSTTSR